MHTLHLAITNDDSQESFDTVAETEYLVGVMRVFGYGFGDGQTFRAMSGPAVVWADARRRISLRLQGCEGGDMLVITAAEEAACEELYEALSDRIPVLRLSVPQGSFLLPWLTGQALPRRGRVARGTYDGAVAEVVELVAEAPDEYNEY